MPLIDICRSRLLVSIVVAIVLPVALMAQSNEARPSHYRAIHWSMADGLPADGGNVMLKDEKGFMWLSNGSAELCRFDGINFKKYFPSESIPGSINSNSISELIEDSLKNILMVTKRTEKH